MLTISVGVLYYLIAKRTNNFVQTQEGRVVFRFPLSVFTFTLSVFRSQYLSPSLGKSSVFTSVMYWPMASVMMENRSA